MLQMLLKEVSYFLYKPLVFFLTLFIRTAVPRSLSSTTPPVSFVLICLSMVMKGKQAFLITVPPWELGSEKACVRVVTWCVMRHNIVPCPPVSCTAVSEARVQPLTVCGQHYSSTVQL